MKSQLTALATPKPEIIRRLADATLGWPYVFGAWGEPCTPANRKRRARSDHPTIKSRCPALNGKSCADCQWGIGVRQYDCRGYTRWLLQQVGLDIVNGAGQACQTVTNQYNAKNNWIRRGPIKEMPNVVCCVFDLKNGHTGMHVGDGEIRHCSVNVQTGSTSQARWTNYAIPKGLYREEEIPMTQVLPPTLRQGMAGDNVKRMQEILILLGYDCGKKGADGKFGQNTFNALVKFQTDALLNVDGVCGPKTWQELLKAEALVKPAPLSPAETSPQQAGATDLSASAEASASDPLRGHPQSGETGKAETYRVTVEGATYEQYRRILDICPLAEAEKEG